MNRLCQLAYFHIYYFLFIADDVIIHIHLQLIKGFYHLMRKHMNSVPFCFSLYSIIILCSLEAVFIPHFNRVFHYFIVFANELSNARISGLANTFARSSGSTSSNAFNDSFLIRCDSLLMKTYARFSSIAS